MIRCFSQKLVLMNAVMVSYGNRYNILSCFSSFPLNVFSEIRSKCFHFHTFKKSHICMYWNYVYPERVPSPLCSSTSHIEDVSQNVAHNTSKGLVGQNHTVPHLPSTLISVALRPLSSCTHTHTHTSFTTSHSVICFPGSTTVSTTAAAATQKERERRRSLVEEITFQTMVTVRLSAGISQERIQ